MKTLIIESVSNGWIVRTRPEPQGAAYFVDEPVAVFNSISDLQTALPVLLDIVSIGIPITDPHAAVGNTAPACTTGFGNF